MSVARIAGRYAKSVLDLANERNELATVLEDMEGVAKVTKNRELHLLLKSPIVNTGKKMAIFTEIFGGKISTLSMEFFKIIMRKGREMYIPEIAEEFLLQYKTLKHISSAKLTTASPLPADILESIKAKLLASDVTDESVEIETEVDPSILGGFIIEIGDKRYDTSVKHKLASMRKGFGKNDFIKSI